MPTLLLAGKPVEIAEPVFKDLKRILKAYNQLGGDNALPEKLHALETIIHALHLPVKLTRLKAGELETLLKSLPEICHLTPATDKRVNGQETDWGGLYAHLAACFGWTYDYIDSQMTLSRLEELQPYLQKNPPVHQLAAAYLGYEYQDKNESKSFLAAIAAQVKASQGKRQ